jgi:hypothetical protein
VLHFMLPVDHAQNCRDVAQHAGQLVRLRRKGSANREGSPLFEPMTSNDADADAPDDRGELVDSDAFAPSNGAPKVHAVTSCFTPCFQAVVMHVFGSNIALLELHQAVTCS